MLCFGGELKGIDVHGKDNFGTISSVLDDVVQELGRCHV